MGTGDLHRDILAATMQCVSRWGLSKTTLDDIAREAGCSRATVYRLFPGGKENLLRQLVLDEVKRFFSSIAHRLEHALDVEELLVEGLTEALSQLREHPALGFLLEHEPSTIFPHPASRAMRQVVEIAGAFLTPHLGRWLEPPQARQAADWVVRIALSYAITPVEAPRPDDPFGVRALVDDLLAPALDRLSSPVASIP
jgi:AcrR family transcriptional regulator